jgi:hypothetical protein
MPDSLMRPQSASLRIVAFRLALPEMPQVVKQPGVSEAFRVTVQYHDGRHPDSIATLVKTQSGGGAALTVAYRRSNDKPLTLNYTIDAERFQAVGAALRKVNFDKLDDLPNIPWFGADLWLIERAAGTFHHDMIVAPDSAIGVHAEIVTVIRDNLREAVRLINT